MKSHWFLAITWLFSGTLVASADNALPTSNLFGSWSENCSVLDGGKGSIRLSYSFTGNEFFSDNLFINGSVYYDDHCRHIAISHIFYGRYRAGGRYGDGFEIDLNFDRRFITGYHDDDIRAMNQIGYCGRSDWRFGISKLVALKSCDRSFTGKMIESIIDSIGTIYDIRTSKGSSYLVFGKYDDKGGRPTRLDLSRKFFRR